MRLDARDLQSDFVRPLHPSRFSLDSTSKHDALDSKLVDFGLNLWKTLLCRGAILGLSDGFKLH